MGVLKASPNPPIVNANDACTRNFIIASIIGVSNYKLKVATGVHKELHLIT